MAKLWLLSCSDGIFTTLMGDGTCCFLPFLEGETSGERRGDTKGTSRLNFRGDPPGEDDMPLPFCETLGEDLGVDLGDGFMISFRWLLVEMEGLSSPVS